MTRVLRPLVMILLAGIILLPFLWTLSTSLKPLSEVNRVPLPLRKLPPARHVRRADQKPSW